ncbi:MAG: glycogen-debranching protein [Burkholderiaceae bacterium]|nr:glycogen-debranching protein [Burkholderiaceae bacterium]
MRFKSIATLALAAAAACAIVPPAAQAAVNSQNLGAKYDSSGANITFRVYSSRASRIELDLFSTGYGQAEAAKYLLVLDPNTPNVWQVTVPVSSIQAAGITGSVYYGYRAWGPNWPYNSSWTKGSSVGFVSDVDSSGNRFNPNKLLYDPYALELSQDPVNATWTDSTVYASGSLYRTKDSGLYASKGIVLPNGSNSTGTKPTRAQKDDIVYEVNVRGLTKNDSSIASTYQGTYKGAGQKASYLASLGVTAVEFLPVQETQNDANDNTPNSDVGQNYWGYSTLNYFAPDRRYSSDKSAGGPTKEFQAMVAAFHNAGIKVYLDVVYNHTGEGYAWNSNDPTTYNVMSYRGLDNPTYYELTSDNQGNYDNTGVGGNYNTYNTIAQNLIVDSLYYWNTTMGVDGFRFDLASVLGNTCTQGCYNFSNSDPNTAIARIPRELTPRPASGGSGVDLIAEPWAIGGNSYQVGGFPVGWSEWNGVYRDTLREAQNDMGVIAVTPSQLATRFAGSSDYYQGSGRSPWNSVNFMVAHDGFTLKDLYSCNGSNNSQAWPYGPSDGGSTSNYSWDQGGGAADQRAAARVGFAFMMLSAGTPMMTGGDEFLRTINCNNNPYNLDSSGNWLSYSWSTDQSNFNAYVKGMIAFRKAHAALRPVTWYTSSQLAWYTPAGTTPDSTYWNSSSNHDIAYVFNGSALGDTYSQIYVGYNGWSASVNFTLPSPGSGKNWYRVTDTCAWDEGSGQVTPPGSETFIGGSGYVYGICGRGLLLLIAK